MQFIFLFFLGPIGCTNLNFVHFVSDTVATLERFSNQIKFHFGLSNHILCAQASNLDRN